MGRYGGQEGRRPSLAEASFKTRGGRLRRTPVIDFSDVQQERGRRKIHSHIDRYSAPPTVLFKL